MAIKGILWDFDDTLVDSEANNREVILAVLEHFYPDVRENPPEAIRTLKDYQKANHKYKNWQDLYHYAFGIPWDRIGEAGSYWEPEQSRNMTIPELFPHMKETVLKLSGIPMGICSQNAKSTIERALSAGGILDRFDVIIGCMEAGFDAQKPDPAGFIMCTERMGIRYIKGEYVYIGDHRDDVTFARNAEQILGEKVYCITFDGVGLTKEEHKKWEEAPDHYVNNAKDLFDVIENIKSSY